MKISVTRRYIDFLFGSDSTDVSYSHFGAVMYERKGDPQELVRYLDETRWRIDEAEGEWALPTTDDDHTGEDVD